MNYDDRGQDTSLAKEADVSAQAADVHPAENGSFDENEGGMEALLRDSDFEFRRLRRGDTVEGTVVRVDQDEVLVDIGLKSEGVIPARELLGEDEEAEPLHVGDRTLVYVMQPETQEGNAVLSLRRAQAERSWRDIEDAYHRGVILDAPVVDFNKGGLIVDLKGVRGFVPVSQVLDLRNVSRQEGENEEVNQTLAAMKGRRLPLKIIEINRSRNRLILSERAAVQEQRTQKKDELMDHLEPSQIRHGRVSNLTSFGAFVDLGGADGLVHVSELSYNRVNHPSEVLQVGQEVDVYVLSVDRETKKIALSLKRALPDPWSTVDETYHIGQVVPATITKLAKFGAFAKVEEGLEGLIHLSELTDQTIQDASQVVQEGQPINAKIIHINSQRRRLGLSVRQAQEPAGYAESYGEIDEESPFAAQGLSDYIPAEETAPDSVASEADLDAVENEVAASSSPESEPAPVENEPTSSSASLEDEPIAAEGEAAPSSPSPEGEPITGEQDSPAAEFEPAIQSTENESPAVAPEDAPPAATDASTSEEEQQRVASAASAGNRHQ